MAAPMVAGTVALLKSIDPDASPVELKKVLVQTGDPKEICKSKLDMKSPSDLATSDPSDIHECQGDTEVWPFLRADKAVAKLLSERVDAKISDGPIAVPSDMWSTVDNQWVVRLNIENSGEMPWTFHIESSVKAPSRSEIHLQSQSVTIKQGPRPHPVNLEFFPLLDGIGPGCWDLNVRVWMEDPKGASTPINDTLEHLTVRTEPITQLDEMEWVGALEVRRTSGEPLNCPGKDKTTPLPEQTRSGSKANVLLLADTSGSMAGNKELSLRQAISEFIDCMYEIQFHPKGGVDPDLDHVGLNRFDTRL